VTPYRREKPCLRRALFLVALLGGACGPAKTAAPRRETLVVWPTPAGWRKETMTFPLAFAPSLAYRGHEALRFAQSFFDPNADTYFTYTFAFILDDAPPFAPERFAADLRVYFQGLMSSVGKKPSPPEHHTVTLTGDATAFRGAAETVDAFGDGRRVELSIVGESQLCGGRRIILASLSPRPPSDPIWSALESVRRTLQCREL